MFEGGEVTYRRSKDSKALDTALLLKDQPQLLDQYSLVKPGVRRFLVRTRHRQRNSKPSINKTNKSTQQKE